MFRRKKINAVLSKIEQNFDEMNKNIQNYNLVLNEIKNKIINLENSINQTQSVCDDKLNNIKNEINSVIMNEKNNIYNYLDNNYCNSEYLHLDKKYTKCKRILLIGFYGAYNLGDELMLNTLVKFFEEYKNIELTIMLANNKKYNIFDYKNIKFIHYPRTQFDIELLAEYYDCFVFGGGAILDDQQYNVQYAGEISLSTTVIELSIKAQEKKKETYFIGLSVNHSITNTIYIERLSKVVEKAKYFSLRDKYSIEVLNKVGINVSNIEVIDDIVLANNIEKHKNKKYKKNKVLNIGVILISVDVNIEDFNLSLLKTLNEEMKKKGIDYQINLIPFYNYNECDTKYYEELISKLGLNNIKITPYVNTLDGISKIFNEQDRIISMRYHGALLSLFMNIDTLTIVDDFHPHYPNKMKYLYTEYGFKENVLIISKSNEEELILHINRLIEGDKNNFSIQKIINRNMKKIELIIKSICKD